MKRIVIIGAILTVTILTAYAQETVPERSLSLNDCVEMASDGNVAVRNSHLDYLSAKTQKREAFTTYFPTVNATAMGFQALNPLVRIGLNDLLGSSDAANNLKYYLDTEAAMSGFSTTYKTLSNAYGAGLTLSQPVFAGGRIINGNRLASLGIEAAGLQENITRKEVSVEVESKYWRVISLEEKLLVIDRAISLTDSLLKDAGSALSAGLVTDDASDRVWTKKQELRAQQVRLKGGIVLARMDLCEAVGIPVSEAISLRLSDRLPVVSDPQAYWKDPAEAVAQMDESRLLEMTVKQKQLEKKIAMGEALPQVGVSASYGYGHIIGSPQMNGMVYATVKIPLSDWSKAAQKMRRLEYQKEKAENDRDHYGAMLELKLRQLWIEVEACWEEYALKQENVTVARKAADRSEADLTAGLVTSNDVMEKQLALSTALCEEIDARIAFRNALCVYLAETGWENL